MVISSIISTRLVKTVGGMLYTCRTSQIIFDYELLGFSERIFVKNPVSLVGYLGNRWTKVGEQFLVAKNNSESHSQPRSQTSQFIKTKLI